MMQPSDFIILSVVVFIVAKLYAPSKKRKRKSSKRGSQSKVIHNLFTKYKVLKHHDYDAYMKSAHWREMRKKTVAKHPYCASCGCKYSKNNPLHVHHLTYYDKHGKSILYREKPKHLKVLCRDCHMKLHGEQRRYKKAA